MLRRLVWWNREDKRDESLVHLFPEGPLVALCGRPIPSVCRPDRWREIDPGVADDYYDRCRICEGIAVKAGTL